jgi:hypothetical protein
MGGLRKYSKATTLMDRRIVHARQLFSERIARAESEYHDAMRRAVMAEVEAPVVSSETTEAATTAPAVEQGVSA